MTIKLTYQDDHGNTCEREWPDDWVLDTDQGEKRADEIEVGMRVRTTPKIRTRISAVEVVA